MEVPDHYTALGVPRTADITEIRRKYLALSLSTHPDKAGPASAVHFERVCEAWRVLSDPVLRRAFDEALSNAERHGRRPVELQVDLDEMDDHGDGTYGLPCRCGAPVVISESDMEAGLDTIDCPDCNLRYRVLYTLAS
eukprot:m.5837 g.5837  ORF g.5837 m.5837 type:complete len:138 (-) comp2040_c0_seq1:490-903(-)